ncbi:hypothetical protein FLA105534_01395 [Flavobacterium bizetiae]|uniref:Uncharacterized protein n=1 Tax=Flavobacterium bizetiae TaxID=2704140 RepID=A0A6J4GCV4_9FLAO|nr:hypothetical protein FLA105534_01395 [Flavobacterium bizetiae]CAD5340215.1 hypothetical protein FLA105535_00169 [Flavobacterium bizetiae]CAD5348065.1 hypothetical protein FLA105534_02024 [Flavobacterium bizetiae]
MYYRDFQGGVKWKKKEVKIAINYYFGLKFKEY